MRLTLALLVTAFTLAQTPAPEPYPGQRQHQKPPDGWFCSHDSQNPAKKCECQKVDTSHDCDDPSTVMEDRKCLTYCWRSHCHCKVGCQHDQSPMPDGETPSPTQPAGPSHDHAGAQS